MLSLRGASACVQHFLNAPELGPPEVAHIVEALIDRCELVRHSLAQHQEQHPIEEDVDYDGEPDGEVKLFVRQYAFSFSILARLSEIWWAPRDLNSHSRYGELGFTDRRGQSYPPGAQTWFPGLPPNVVSRSSTERGFQVFHRTWFPGLPPNVVSRSSTNGARGENRTPVLTELQSAALPSWLRARWRRAEESNPHPFGALVFRTSGRPFRPRPPHVKDIGTGGGSRTPTSEDTGF